MSWCAERGQTSEPLGQALSAVLKEARPPTSPDRACRPQLLLSALPPRPAAPPSQVPGASARPTPARPWEAALGSSILSSSPALRPGIRPKRVLHLVVPALSRLRPPGSIVQAADPQTPIGLQSRLLLRLWPQELPCSTVVSSLRNFLHSRPPQHALPLGLRPQPPPTPLRQPEEGRLEQKLLRRTHGQRVPRHPSDRGYQMVLTLAPAPHTPGLGRGGGGAECPLVTHAPVRLAHPGAAHTLRAGWVGGGAVRGAEGGAAAHLPRLSLLPSWKGELTETLARTPPSYTGHWRPLHHKTRCGRR